MIILIFQVQHKPVCQVNLTRDIFLHLKEMAEVVCRVVASPAPSHYWWTFNNTFQLGRRPRSKEIQGVQEKLCLLPWPFKRMQDMCRVDCYWRRATFWRTIAADSWQGREAEYRKFSSESTFKYMTPSSWFEIWKIDEHSLDFNFCLIFGAK